MQLLPRKGVLAIAAVIDIALNARGRPVAAKALAQGCVIERRDVARAAGRTFDDVDVGQFQRVEPIDDVIEQRLRIGIGDIIRRRHRGHRETPGWRTPR